MEMITKFIKSKWIKSGGFGIVYTAQEIKTSNIYAEKNHWLWKEF